MIGGTRRTDLSTVTTSCGRSRSIATIAVMIFVVEAIGRRTWIRLPQSTSPVRASIRIAERAVSAIPWASSGPGWWTRAACLAEAAGASTTTSASSRGKSRLTLRPG